MYSQQIRICDLWPQVECIKIEYSEDYTSFIGKHHTEGTANYKPDFLAEFKFKCINVDCTGNGFDLGNEVWQAVHFGISEISGKKECSGMEAKDYHNHCPCRLSYTIRVDTCHGGSPQR